MLAPQPFIITLTVLSLIMLGRYFALAGSFYWICSRTSRSPIASTGYKDQQNKNDIKWSLLSSFIFALGGAVLIELWHRGATKIYLDVQDYGRSYLFFSLLLLMFLHDTYFYWTHRLLHHQALFQRFHRAHHESRVPTAWTSFAFHPLEALIQALILPVLVLIVPVHWSVLVIWLSLMTLFGLLNHLGYEYYPAVLEHRFGLISATHHQFHHQKVNKNFGLYFTWWDHWMKTEGQRHD